MLDPGTDLVGAMDDDDEDLFSVYERSPLSSQASTSPAMMLEPDEDKETMLEEDMLSCAERCHQFSSASFQANVKVNLTKTIDGPTCTEDIEFEPLEHGCKDGEGSASMMLF